MVYEQARRGDSVAVMTLFAGSPSGASHLSSFAQLLHERWQASMAAEGADFIDPPLIRREEDRRAFAALSPTIQVIHYRLPDCIYRLHPAAGEALYPDANSIFGDVHPDDPAHLLLQAAPPLPEGATLYVPLGVGHHVDHQLTFNSARRWNFPTEQVRCYADYPYVLQFDALDRALAGKSSWERLTAVLSEAALRSKVQAVGEYASQVSTFWQNAEDLDRAIRDYAEQMGGEPLWIERT